MESGAAPAAVVSKSQFAALINVSQGRVSQYIAAGKLKGDALTGEGRDQKIVVDAACRQLKRSLDIGQRLGNGIDTRLDLTPPAMAPSASQAKPAPAVEPADPVEEQIKRARLAQIEFANRKAAEDEAARSGRLTDAESCRLEMGRLGAQIVNVYEGSLAEIASAFAAKFQVPQRDALHLLRSEIRKVRASAAAIVRQQAAELAETVEHEIEESAQPS
jgi:hypothetical protein